MLNDLDGLRGPRKRAIPAPLKKEQPKDLHQKSSSFCFLLRVNVADWIIKSKVRPGHLSPRSCDLPGVLDCFCEGVDLMLKAPSGHEGELQTSLAKGCWWVASDL